MRILLSFITLFSAFLLFGQNTKDVLSSIKKNQKMYNEAALKIWNLAEVGYQEYESSKILIDLLKSEGFTIEEGVAGIPTAFVATYGTGSPVLGVLGEYDALPGISQKATTSKQPLIPEGAGHACGHHLFGVASAASAIAAKEWLQKTKSSGTIKFFGTPAEEGGSGKVYMVREGLFEGVDAVLHWHPSGLNAASPFTTLSNKTGKFRFYGVSAHASGAPERGRSALDGVEAMNHMVNMMREHTTEKTRIHYVITKGGKAPNVVPDFAEVYYYVRHPDPQEVKELWNRLENAAKGAALGTDTEVKIEVTGGVYNVLRNDALQEMVYNNLIKVGGITYSEDEVKFATEIATTLGKSAKPLTKANEVEAFQFRTVPASTDVGDVSWAVPTAGLNTATWVPGTAAHSWQAVAAGGMTIGLKGMEVAAKTLALSLQQLYTDDTILTQAAQEFKERQGSNFTYEPLIGQRAPALDYRK